MGKSPSGKVMENMMGVGVAMPERFLMKALSNMIALEQRQEQSDEGSHRMTWRRGGVERKCNWDITAGDQ